MNKFGQFRSSQLNTYLTTLTYIMSNTRKSSSAIDNIIFENTSVKMNNANLLNSSNCYYLRFKITQRADGEQRFFVKLLNSEKITDNEQIIGKFTAPEGTSFSYFELVFQPNATYDTIVFQLQRVSLDYNLTNTGGTSGRIISVEIISLDKLINIIDFLKESYNGLEYLIKIGIQGPASLLMCINGEEIRIGKNQIYEIDNIGYKITFLGIVTNNNSFLIDFEY